MTIDEKNILKKVFANLLNIDTEYKYKIFKEDITDLLDQYAHDYALNNHDLDRERYMFWHDIKLMLDDTSLYNTGEH